ncbi:hypothetical protein [Microbacterium natoriense]
MPAIRATPESVEARAVAVLASGEMRYADLSAALSAPQRRHLWDVVNTSPHIVVEASPNGGHRVRLRDAS